MTEPKGSGPPQAPQAVRRSRAAVASPAIAVGTILLLLGAKVLLKLAEYALTAAWFVAIAAGPFVALGFGLKGYRDVQAGKACGREWAISGIVLAIVDLSVKIVAFYYLSATHFRV